MSSSMNHTTFVSIAALACAGLAFAATTQPAAAFFGSFQASCRDVTVYGGGAAMTAYCRRIDGTWRFARIHNCGGAGVRNDDGYLRCGT